MKGYLFHGKLKFIKFYFVKMKESTCQYVNSGRLIFLIYIMRFLNQRTTHFKPRNRAWPLVPILDGVTIFEMHCGFEMVTDERRVGGL